MKNFDQLSPEAQNTIKIFREHFWSKLKKHNTNLSSLIFNNNFTVLIAKFFVIFSDCPYEEANDVLKFLKSKNFYLKVNFKQENY